MTAMWLIALHSNSPPTPIALIDTPPISGPGKVAKFCVARNRPTPLEITACATMLGIIPWREDESNGCKNPVNALASRIGPSSS
jgi:hypothetical protein